MHGMRFIPQPLGDGQGIDTHLVPPRPLVAVVVEFAMMITAERYGELVADFCAEGLGLGEADVMSIGQDAVAQNAGLRRDVAEVVLVA